MLANRLLNVARSLNLSILSPLFPISRYLAATNLLSSPPIAFLLPLSANPNLFFTNRFLENPIVQFHYTSFPLLVHFPFLFCLYPFVPTTFILLFRFATVFTAVPFPRSFVLSFNCSFVICCLFAIHTFHRSLYFYPLPLFPFAFLPFFHFSSPRRNQQPPTLVTVTQPSSPLQALAAITKSSQPSPSPSHLDLRRSQVPTTAATTFISSAVQVKPDQSRIKLPLPICRRRQSPALVPPLQDCPPIGSLPVPTTLRTSPNVSDASPSQRC